MRFSSPAFGVRNFRLSLRQAADGLESIRTAEGTPLPDNTRAELYRFLELLYLEHAQIRTIKQDVFDHGIQTRLGLECSWNFDPLQN